MSLEINKSVSHYQVISKIASGGMGDVYLAEDTRLKRKVALKVLSSALSANIKFKELFLKEAQAAAHVEHAHIVTIHEIIEHEGNPIIVMEYVEGETLQTILDREKLSEKTVIEIMLQICSALDEAHSAGIIHRDIKSSNLILDSKGQIRILDFGLAGHSKDMTSRIVSESSGTLGYLSPEQIQGNEITTTSDLFSLGVLFYKMLTGKMPFESDYDAATKYAIVNDQPDSISELNPDINEDVEKIVFKLLEKNQNDRIQTAQDVISQLESLHPVSEKIQKLNKSKQNYYIGIAAILILLIISMKLFYDTAQRTMPDKIMLAVLPFNNSGVGKDEDFSNGITEALSSTLGKIDNIGVISQRSAMLYKNSELSMTDVGDELSVDYLLTGTIHWDKNDTANVRIYTALIDSENDIQVWTNHYDIRIEEYFAIQSSISKEITQALHLVLSEIDQQDLTNIPTVNFEAYNLYLKGNEYFHRSWGKNDVNSAKDLYEQAIAKDSNFAAAYAMLSRCYSSMYFDYYDHTAEACTLSKQLAEKSLSLQDEQAKGFEALGYYYYHCEMKFDTALAIFSEGLDNDLNNSDLYNAVAATLRRLGRFEESTENFRHAFRLDPRSHLKAFDVALTYGMMGQFDSSEFYAQKSITIAPDYSFGHIYYIWLPILTVGNINEASNRLAQAEIKTDLTSSKYYWWLLRTLKIDAVPTLNEITPGTDTISYYLYIARSHRLNKNYVDEKIYSDSVLTILKDKIVIDPNDAKFNCALGLAYAGLRNKEKAFQYGQKAMQLLDSSKESFDAPFIIMDFAEIQMIFGEDDSAIELLKLVHSKSGFFSYEYFKADPLWKNLIQKKSFKKFLQKRK